MGPQGGYTGELSPNQVRTALDTTLFEEYSRTQQPQYLSAEDGFFFKQGSTEGKTQFIWEEDQNVGNYDEADEQEDFLNTTTRTANKKTVASQKYYKQVPISDEAFRADQHGKRQAIGIQCGDRARQTRDQQAILNTWGDGFAGSLHTTPDGQALYSNSHTAISGTTVDNLETGSLTADNAWTAVTSLANQKAQDGDAGSHVFEGFLCPFTSYKTAKETFNSTLAPFSAENQINVFDTDYGTIRIYSSIFLGSTYNSAANADTSVHYISSNHMIMRKVFYGLTTSMIPPEYSSNDSYIYRNKFHEVAFPGSWTGVVGSNGTA